MTFCAAHEQALRDGLTTRVGVYPERLLEAACLSMKKQVVERGGLEFVSGDQCPLCEAYLHGGYDEEWIRGCLSAEVTEYKRQEFLRPRPRSGN